MPDSSQDADFLRRAIALSRSAVANGNHPFGALLTDAKGAVLSEAENGFMPSHDATAHAERLIATQASIQFKPEILSGATLYSSAEPCAMCAGAIYWAGIGRLVYGLSESRLKQITGNHPENPTLDLPCRDVFAAGQRTIEVVGPMLEDEAAAPHEDFWTPQRA
jgi:tRNA(Arg) A34 adenosine deaminase TadA